MNNVILIYNENNKVEEIKSNLILLRKFDSIITCDILNAQNIINQNKAQIIILYSKNIDEKVINLVGTIKDIPILFITEEINDEELLTLYETGISDFITMNNSQTEFLIKVMQCLKKAIDYKKLNIYYDILTQIGILKTGTEFYSQKYTPAVFKNIISKYHNKTPLTIMAFAPDIEIKDRYNFDYLTKIISTNLREEDIIGLLADKIYVLLPNTNKQGALEVYNKIKSLLNKNYTICAGILEIKNNKKYNEISQKVDEALTEALLLKNCVVVQEDFESETAVNWLDKSNKKYKSFKLFKRALLKKIEKIITPVFYQKQKFAEQRLFETEVTQYTNEKESKFILKNKEKHSILEIKYPAAAKFNIYVYKNLYEDTAPDYLSYEISEINEQLINEILDNFIKEFYT